MRMRMNHYSIHFGKAYYAQPNTMRDLKGIKSTNTLKAALHKLTSDPAFEVTRSAKDSWLKLEIRGDVFFVTNTPEEDGQTNDPRFEKLSKLKRKSETEFLDDSSRIIDMGNIIKI